MEAEEIKRITSYTYTDQARENWKQSGLSYSDINAKNLALLRYLINIELRPDLNLPMTISKPLVKDFKFNKDSSLVHGFFKVDSHYFTKREAISFNEGGFIGFAGWADRGNVQPFTVAFNRWVNQISQSF